MLHASPPAPKREAPDYFSEAANQASNGLFDFLVSSSQPILPPIGRDWLKKSEKKEVIDEIDAGDDMHEEEGDAKRKGPGKWHSERWEQADGGERKDEKAGESPEKEQRRSTAALHRRKQESKDTLSPNKSLCLHFILLAKC